MGHLFSRNVNLAGTNNVEDIIMIDADHTTPIVGIEMVPIVHLKRLGACIFEWHRLAIDNNNNNVGTFMADDLKLQIPILVSQSVSYIPTVEDVKHRLRFTVTFIGDLDKSGVTRRRFVTSETIPLPEKTPARTWTKNKLLVKAKRIYYPPLNDSKVQYSLSFQQRRNNCRFTILSYDLFGKKILEFMSSRTNVNLQRESVSLKNPFPNCPIYVMTEVYRRKVLYRELVSYNADLMCLQCVNSKEYDRWYLDLSKIGYSGLFKGHHNLSQTASSQENNDTAASIDYGDQSKFGFAILYKRARFNRVKDWVVKLSNDDSIQALLNGLLHDGIINDVQKNSCLDRTRSNDIVAIIMELEFKESRDMIDYMRQYTTRDKVVYSNYDDTNNDDDMVLKLLVVTMRIDPSFSPDDIIPLIITHIVMEHVNAIIHEHNNEKSRISVMIAGNLSQDYRSLPYLYLSRCKSARMQLQEAATFFGVQCDEEKDQVTSSEKIAQDRSSNEYLTTCDTEKKKHDILSKISHGFELSSCYGITLGEELKYATSDAQCSIRRTSNFIWYEPKHMQVRCVAREAPERSFPNIHFISEHVAMFAEMELSLMMNNIEQSKNVAKSTDGESVNEHQVDLDDLGSEEDPFAEDDK